MKIKVFDYLNEMKDTNISFYAWASSASFANLSLCVPLWPFHFESALILATSKAIKKMIDFNAILLIELDSYFF